MIVMANIKYFSLSPIKVIPELKIFIWSKNLQYWSTGVENKRGFWLVLTVNLTQPRITREENLMSNYLGQEDLWTCLWGI